MADAAEISPMLSKALLGLQYNEGGFNLHSEHAGKIRINSHIVGQGQKR